jgi:putative tricarboxylic transport membrane protein
MSNVPGDEGPPRLRDTVKSPLDLGGGLFLISIGALGFTGAFALPVGHLSGIGSGLLPKAIAVLVAVFGMLLTLQGLLTRGDPLERWSIRGPLFVLGSVVLFAMTIRPCGLVIAGPLAVIMSSIADKDTRPAEIAIFSIVVTMLSGILFKELLSLPIPFDPLGVVPDPLIHGYANAKTEIGRFFVALTGLISR